MLLEVTLSKYDMVSLTIVGRSLPQNYIVCHDEALTRRDAEFATMNQLQLVTSVIRRFTRTVLAIPAQLRLL